MQTQGSEGKKKWIQPPWTPERRENHRAFCQAAAMMRKELIKRMAFTREHKELIAALSRIQKRYGIEPIELMMFIYLLPKDQHPLTEDQNRQWRELAIKKIPAAEIYQRMFGGAV